MFDKLKNLLTSFAIQFNDLGHKREHQKDSKEYQTEIPFKFTRTNWKATISEQHKSGFTDYIAQKNHSIDWEGASILDTDSNSRLIVTRYLGT